MITGNKMISFAGKQEGLTLLEIVLAMLMLATVVSMVTMSISGSLRVVDATEQQGEAYYRAQVVLQRITEDLSSALLVDDIEFSGNNKENDSSRGNILEFTTTSHVIFDPGNDHPGIALVAYILKQDRENDQTFVLLRRDNLLRPYDKAEDYRDDTIDAFLLCDKVRSLTFTYVDETGDEVESWSSAAEDFQNPPVRKLPVSVKVSLDLWLDDQQQDSIVFTTGVLLPVALLNDQSAGNP